MHVDTLQKAKTYSFPIPLFKLKTYLFPMPLCSHNRNNDRNTKGGRGSRHPTRDGKRAYDRRSGTGRGKETKKGGGGARNWGSDKNDARRAEGAVVEGKEAVNTPEAEEAEDNAAENVKVVEVVEEEEPDNTMTFEEYMKAKENPDNDAFKPLSEREAEDEFAGKAPRVAKEEDFLVMGGGKQPRKKVSRGKEKQSIDVGFRVAKAGGGGDGDRRERPRRDDRGGRGGESDRRSRGHGRGLGRDGSRGSRRGKSANVNTTDRNAFPSL